MRRTWRQIKNETMGEDEQRQAHVLATRELAEMEDYLDIQDPKVREHIRRSHEEFLAGKHRSAKDLLDELKRGKSWGRSRRGQMPSFKNESEEADWWASPAGRAYVRQRSAEASSKGAKTRASGLVAKSGEKRSAQVSIGVGMEKDKERRKGLAALPFSEKLKILAKLRERDRAIASSGLRKKKVRRAAG